DPYITRILEDLLSNNPWIKALTDWLLSFEALSFLKDFSAAQDGALFVEGVTLVPLFIGVIMTFDNIFGVIFQPTFGKISDRCRSKYGKRRPFVIFGAPVSALLFLIIPIVFLAFRGTENPIGLPVTMACIILFVFSMSLWRAPVVALMPALTPPALRSEGNAIINLMGGIGSAVGLVAGTIGIALCGLFTGLSQTAIKADEFVAFPYVFAIGTIVMLLGMLVVRFFVKEPDSRLQAVSEQKQVEEEAAKIKAEKEAKKAEKAAKKAVKLSKSEKKSLIFMLGCLFFLFCGTNAITTFFSLFAKEILHMVTSDATFLMTLFAVCSGAAAIPAGKLGKKFGRKKTILAGLSIFLSAFVIFFGIFLGMLGKQDLKVKDYVTINNAYTFVNEELNNFNSQKADEYTAEQEQKAIEHEKATGEKVKLSKEDKKIPEADVLSMAKYVEYKKAVTAGADVSAYSKNYAEFDAAITEKTVPCENLIKVTNNVLGKNVSTLEDAIVEIETAVDDITSLLSILIYPVLVLGGAANMFITVNTLPLVLDIGGIEKVGTFTGYYYTATFSAQIASPILYGFIRMFAQTYMSLFYYSPIMFILSLLMILFVKHGEAVPDEVVKKVAEEND
ncbi:MAG: MFS transporter, partial [Acutalibacteraceae bacterium]|nr:MFS transporter [Acutalibacteraceae bacterium]